MKTRFRLIDAVVLAAVALLALKGLDYLRRDQGAPVQAQTLPTPQARPSPVRAVDDLPAFGRALSYAHSDARGAEIVATGSTETAPAAADAPPADALAPRETSRSPAEQAILERLEDRRQNIQQRDKDLELRERLLEQAEQRLEARLRSAREQEGAAAPADIEEQRRAGMRNIVAMYQAMRPKDAARVFDRLGLDILVPVALEMNPRTMAEILAAMSPEAAERLTVALARRAQGEQVISRNVGVQGAGTPNELPALELPPRR
ncbi:MAG: hypothetical protein EA385_13335 [Salinarimonadaceae bacterium]|nr:MAG: hypothetical protein EA385_13335 [Salinarimonadaceae bacterium]